MILHACTYTSYCRSATSTLVYKLSFIHVHSVCIQFKYFFCTISPYTLETDLGVVGDCIVQQIESISCNCCPHNRSRAAWCSVYGTTPSPSGHNWDHYEHNYSVKMEIALS